MQVGNKMTFLEKPTELVRKSKQRFKKKQESRANSEKFKKLNKAAKGTASLRRFENGTNRK